MSWLREHCPRLALAVEQHNQAVAAEARKRRKAAGQLCRAERLLAHRELQYVRAMATGNGSYIRKRHGKLRAAEQAVEALRKAA